MFFITFFLSLFSFASIAKDTVNILGIYPFSGPYADSGELQAKGALVALEEVGYKINGKKIKYITRDSETKASVAARRVQEAIDSEEIDFVVGPWSSGSLMVSSIIMPPST